MAISQVRAKIQGQWYTLTYNEATRNYEAYITPTATSYNQPGGYFVAEVEALTDSGGMDTASGEHRQGLRLYVKETTSPILTLISPLEGYLTDDSPLITVQATDEAGGSGIDPASASAYIDGQESACTITQDGEIYTITVQTQNLSEGTHSIAIDIKDNDGNEAATLTAVYFVDTIAPVISLVSPAEGYITTNQPDIVFAASDGGSGVDMNTLTVDLDDVVQTAGISAAGGTITFTPPAALSEGAHSINVALQDKAGNAEELTIDYYVDTIAPSLELIFPLSGYNVTSNQPEIVAMASESGSGLDTDSLEVWIDGARQTAGISISEGQIAFTPGESLVDGEHDVILLISDRAGNTAQLNETFTVDTTAPELRITKPDDGRVIVDVATVVVAGYVSDLTSPPVRVVVGGVEIEADENGFFIYEAPLEVGGNYITVAATDSAGLSTSGIVYRIRLITDRTQADVDALKSLLGRAGELTDAERQEFYHSRHRGAYNYTDMNRVGLAAEYIAARLMEYGYAPDVDGKQSWALADIPTKTQTARYIADIASIKAALPFIEPSPPADMERFTFDKANAIEAVLVQTDAMFPFINKSYIVCGEAVCGEF